MEKQVNVKNDAGAQSNLTDELDTGLGFAMAFFAELSAAQNSMSPDIAKAIYVNLWDLYES